MHDGVFLQAALNGDRVHPRTPRTPQELAGEARGAVAAGAQSVHFHAYDADGRESLDADELRQSDQGRARGLPSNPHLAQHVGRHREGSAATSSRHHRLVRNA